MTLAWKLSEKTRRMAGIGGQPRPQQGSDHLGEAAPARDPGTRGCSAVNSGLLGFPRKPGPERLVFFLGSSAVKTGEGDRGTKGRPHPPARALFKLLVK